MRLDEIDAAVIRDLILETLAVIAFLVILVCSVFFATAL